MRFNISLTDVNSEELIRKIINKYHFEDKDRELLMAVLNEVQASSKAHAVYRINQWNTGVKAIDTSQAAVVAITLGDGVDELQESYEAAGSLQEAYMVEAVSSELLLYLYGRFNSDYARFHRRYVKKYVFIGEDIPLTNMTEILGHLYEKGDVEQEIYANEYGVLIPSKSVVFYALLTDNPNQVCRGICMSCNRVDCENSEYTNREYENTAILNYGIQRILGGA